jgi:hypothetical protein
VFLKKSRKIVEKETANSAVPAKHMVVGAFFTEEDGNDFSARLELLALIVIYFPLFFNKS